MPSAQLSLETLTSSRRHEVADLLAVYLPRDLQEMPAQDLETAHQFQSAAEVALRTGDFGPVVALLAPDVECVTPVHSQYGVEALTEELRSRCEMRFAG